MTTEDPTYEELSMGSRDAEAAAESEASAAAVSRSRRGRALGISAMALALLAGAGVYAAARSSSDQGAQPESALPRTAFAFVKVDLAPDGALGDAVGDLTARFPAAGAKTAVELRTKLVSMLAKSLKIDYATGVQPWLGRRAAIAGFPTAKDKPELVAAVQVTDVAAATAALGRLKTPPAVAVNGDFLVIATNQAVLDAATAATGDEPLAKDAEFAADLGKLAGPQLAVMWSDNTRSAAAAFYGIDRYADSDSPDNYFTRMRESMVGRTVLGLSATSTYAELVSYTTGRGAARSSDPARMLTLPDNTIAAGHIADVSKATTSTGYGMMGPMGLIEDLSPLFSLASMASVGVSMVGVEEPHAAMTAPSSAAASTCVSHQNADDPPQIVCGAAPVVSKRAAAAPAAPEPDDDKNAAAAMVGSPTAAPPTLPVITPPGPALSPEAGSGELDHSPLGDPGSPADSPEFERDEYVDPSMVLLKDFAAALTGGVTIAMGSLPAPGTRLSPDLALIGAAADAGKAQTAAAKAKAEFSKAFTDTPYSAIADGTLTLASDAEYAAKLDSGGLGKTELFKTAMGELTQPVELAIFVNLERIRGNVPGYPKEMLAASAVGLSSVRQGEDTVLRVRVVALAP